MNFDYSYYEERLNRTFSEQWEAEIFARECPKELLTKAKQVFPKKFQYLFLDNPEMPKAWIDEFIEDPLFAQKELLALRIVQLGWLEDKNSDFVEERIFASNHKYNFAQVEILPKRILEKIALDSSASAREAVAHNLNTPEQTLVLLAKDSDEFVRRNVASNPNTPREVLASFAKDGEVMVIAAMAENPNVPADILESFTSYPNETVRGAIAANPFAPSEILERFLEDSSDFVRAQLARNPRISKNAVQKLILDPHDWVRVSLISREDLDLELLKVFAKDKVNNHREMLARKSNLPLEIQSILLKDKSALVRAALAANPDADVELLMGLINDKSRSVLDALKCEMIWRDGTYIRYEGRESLWEAAKEGSKKVEAESKKKSVGGRSEALQSEVFDKARYEELMQDKAIGLQTSATLRAAELGLITFKDAASFVEKHAPQTTAPKNRWVEARMAQFKHDKDESFLDLVIELRGDDALFNLFNEKEVELTVDQVLKIAKARLPRTNWKIGNSLELNEDLLDELAETPSWSHEAYGGHDFELVFGQWEGETTSGYRIASYPQALAANHPKTRGETLEKLKKSRSKYVRGVILQRPDVSDLEDVKKASKDKEAHIRQIAASHPLATLEIIEKLASDKDAEVRKAAIAHPLATPEMKAAAALLN